MKLTVTFNSFSQWLISILLVGTVMETCTYIYIIPDCLFPSTVNAAHNDEEREDEDIC